MTPVDWAVLVGGAAAIAWVGWYFFLADRGSASAAVNAAGAQEVTVTVKGGYTPATVRVHHGALVRLIFDRQERDGCSDTIVLADFGVRRPLPAFRATAVEFTPETPGTFEFTCGMHMLRGQLVVD